MASYDVELKIIGLMSCVLILVVVANGLVRPQQEYRNCIDTGVLILVVVDNGLVLTLIKIYWVGLMCLNPCCS